MKLSVKVSIAPGVLFAEGKLKRDAVEAFKDLRCVGESASFELSEFVVSDGGEVGWDTEGFIGCHALLRRRRGVAPYSWRSLATQVSAMSPINEPPTKPPIANERLLRLIQLLVDG